jgi:hypothetical protein
MRSFRIYVLHQILLGSSDKNYMNMEQSVVEMRNAYKDEVGKSEALCRDGGRIESEKLLLEFVWLQKGTSIKLLCTWQ